MIGSGRCCASLVLFGAGSHISAEIAGVRCSTRPEIHADELEVIGHYRQARTTLYGEALTYACFCRMLTD